MSPIVGKRLPAFSQASEEPIRAELFSADRLEHEAQLLAGARRIASKPEAGRPLAPRLRENARVLTESYQSIARSAEDDNPITPAAEWLLDNFHIVEEQVREIVDHLPEGYYRRLPKLADGPLEGYPRVFGIAWSIVAHTDSGFDEERLSRFVAAYQRVQPLTIGELWAIAITLRLTLVENLRRLAEAIVSGHADYEKANELADRIIGGGAQAAEPLSAILRGLDDKPLSRAFAAQLSQRLRDQDAKILPALDWLERRLAAQGTTIDEIVREEHQFQGATNVTVRNVITSMRLVSAIDWPEFFETVSLVDEALRDGSDFAEMDFPTRDLYRRQIEDLAHHSGVAELDIARRLVAAVKTGDGPPAPALITERRNDPGYYLLADGRAGFERELGFQVPVRRWLARLNGRLGVSGYLGMIAMTTAIVLAATIAGIADAQLTDWQLVVLGFLGLIPASEIAISLVNKAAVDRFGPAILPGLELTEGVPPELRTIVVVPTLLISTDDVAGLIKRLEVHHLASQDGDLYFALLSDWTDSASETAPDDEALLAAAAEGIAALNRRYAPGPGGQRFLLLHRRRVWNEGQGKWMGWERKRGKLHELNRLLGGATDTTFLPIAGMPPAVPAGVRYVITLDADTRLPRGTARRLIGKMAHPLNRPVIDPRFSRVVQGHGILQPRVTPSLPLGRGGSLFQRLFSGANGLDPYAFAVSDVYQDLFAEGSYVGKGIYDVEAFEAALHGRIPENTVLSHDLLEGVFTRAALASDIELVEEYPSRYDVAAARQHRWTRGDWQLLPWIFGRGREKGASRQKALIPLIGRWKMVDNLRRSLAAPATLLALLFGWTLPTPESAIWTSFILATVAFPLVFPPLLGIIPRRSFMAKSRHFRLVGGDLALALMQSGFLLTFLAHQAWLTVDAVLRTIYRLFIGRRRLLEWTTAAQAHSLKWDRRTLSVQLVGSVAFACAAMLVIVVYGDGSWPIAAPFAALWAASPLLARRASKPPPTGELHVGKADARTLRLVARRTWRFFETFITADDHMLPPDNFQEDPQPVVARRTSPTNMGLYLLSVVAARDFGWHGLLATVERLEATLAEMNRMERFRGHFYNWYDTSDLRPLEPKYVSSVDSGNLAGHLIALANACREFIAAPVIDPEWAAGVDDALALARESLDNAPAVPARDSLEQALDGIASVLRDAPAEPVEIAGRLLTLDGLARRAVGYARALSGEGAPLADCVVWSEAVANAIASHQHDLDLLAPWVVLLARDPALRAVFDPRPPDPAAEKPHEAVAPLLRANWRLADVPRLAEDLLLAASSGHYRRQNQGDQGAAHDAFTQALRASGEACRAVIERLSALADAVATMSAGMPFGFLFDPDRQLLSIGYQVAEEKLDGGYYDLLASEARLASFVAIARGDAPARHWFRLGRTLTPVDDDAALVSWSGSMFEYLMPSLVMLEPAGSLLEHTGGVVVGRQIEYGGEIGAPWGVSESQYNVRDLEFTYQYLAFGVPDLGYKRGLAENRVVAPYATALAAMVEPVAAARNFARLAEAGGRGRYGWYDALDYTPERLPEGATVAVVRAYMAHHQAMSVLAIADALQGGRMRARFHAEPIIQATELLLQERMPRAVPVARPPARRPAGTATIYNVFPEMQRRFTSPHARVPRTHLLSNGRYAVMITGAGSGYSRWQGRDITRWREDATCDGWGSYIFLRDTRTGDVWSAGYQPTAIEPESYEVAFSEDRAEITREDGAIMTALVVAVSPEDDAEVRRVSITNHGVRPREIEITSYAELVLAPHADDRAHQAFSKLFVETEFDPRLGALIAHRRPRAAGDAEIWAAHLAVVEGESVGDMQFETDRARFVGRGHGIRKPAASIDGWPLSNTAGAVLDPIFSVRRRVRLPRGSTARIAFWTLVASSRQGILDLIDKHHDAMAYERATTLAWTQGQVQLHHLGITPDEAHLYQRVANRVLYSDPTLRPPSDVIVRGVRPASTLWACGISGDLPIVLVRIDDADDLEIVRQLLHAHEYWRLKQLAVDLVILNEHPPSYAQNLQNAIDTMVRAARLDHATQGPQGGVFVLRSDMISAEINGLLQAASRVVLVARRGSLAEQVRRLPEVKPPLASLPAKRPQPSPQPEFARPHLDLEFFNGFGGFGDGGREYVTILERGRWTPAPWINVIANPSFGFQVSAEGSGYTWSVNSQQNQITAWSNDPVRDPPGEVLYVRDEESGELWTPTALPIREPTTYITRHGQGYSKFEHISHGVALELLQYVPIDDPIKISRLRLVNQSGRARRLSVTAYVEWVLGQSREAGSAFIVTAIDPATGAMQATNRWNGDFGQRVAFADLGGKQTAWTGDRTEFLGRNGVAERPAALVGGQPLSNTVGAGLDSCGALQGTVRLAVDGEAEILFLLGEAATDLEARALVEKYRKADLDQVFATAIQFWEKTVGTVQVKTPDRAMDILVNRWLPYQVLSCRVWARAGFYQASGAYGFRDQLQDVMALCVSRPEIAREHILRAAGRQFPEGDVQHWWLPETGRGIRTRISDDMVWLPYVVAHYVEVTGDRAILDETVPFLDGPVLADGHNEAFFLPSPSQESATLFEHCARGLDRSLTVGAHNLPLMGTGDWNDGMNAVGAGGQGESVWLGWFLHATLNKFLHIAYDRADSKRAASWMLHAAVLKDSLEGAWDGDWYRRAYFDDGSPLGSIQNSECRIDGIAQTWGVISKAAEPARAERAMAAVEKYLVRRDESLILLFSPPFNTSNPSPGYIQGYPPGVRENGGQYTHGAVWSVLAFAMLGDGDRAMELFSLLNPINHGSSHATIHRYKVEPYVACGDIYSMPPQAGRGGWTWYTGSAGWMYRAALEGILGFNVQGAALRIDPCIPRNWPGFAITFQHRSARYDIAIENPHGVSRGVTLIELDGKAAEGLVPLADDGATHRVRVILG